MSTTVKHFHSAMTGAPILNGTAGTLISVLDACLVNGFGLQTASSLVVAGNVATLTVPSAHPFEVDTIIAVAGAVPAGLNGEQRVSASGANTVSFVTSGIADQTATGTITVKLAPVGWGKPFNGSNLAVYRSADVTGTRLCLRVDDSAAQNARVVGYETMSDANTGVGKFPGDAQMSGGYYWPKANSASGTARAWTIIGDGRTFYLYTNTHTTSASFGVDGWLGMFGDFKPTKSGDPYACAIMGTSTDRSAITTGGAETVSHSYTNSLTTAGTAMPRSFTGLGSSALAVRRAESYASSDANSGSVNMVAQYPNGPDNGLLLSRIMLLETTPNLRGFLRGVTWCPQASANNFSWLDKVSGAGNYAGRVLRAIKGQGAPAGTTATSGVVFFDVTGGW